MFAANGASRSTTSIRSSRRRHRTGSDDSFKPPKAKRQRSVAKDNNLEDSGKSASRIGAKPSDAQSSQAGDRTHSGQHGFFQSEHTLDTHREEIPRYDSGGISVVLSHNDYYTISQLPAVPDQILNSNTAGTIQGGFLSDTGYALALTENSAVIWSYSAPELKAGTNIITVTIPESCKGSAQPRTLGVLVPNNAYAIPGLLLLNASTGQIAYWETASNSAALGVARQKIDHAEGIIPGISSGENAMAMVNAEPSGAIVTFSSGRIAHITLRDSMGKPNVSVTLFRASMATGSGGLLHGIRSVLGGVRRKEFVIARPGLSRQRGQRDLILVSSGGLCEIRDTHVNTGSTSRGKFDLRGAIDLAFGDDCLSGHCEHEIKVLDFAVAQGQRAPSAETEQDDSCETDIFLLALSTDSKGIFKAAIIKASLCGTRVKIVSAFSIDDAELFKNLEQNLPRLYVPSSCEAAFITVGRLLILKSLTYGADSPSAQLLNESRKPLTTFQDRVQFRDEAKYEIIAGEIERQSKDHVSSACILLVRGFGIVRITFLPRDDIGVDSGSGGLQLTAKQKLEQAVFYGSVSQSPLDLGQIGSSTFAVEELEHAALAISREILQSKSRFISNACSSLEQQLRLRSKALNDLVLQLNRQKVSISRQGRWELLWSAEKLASQRALWDVESEFRRAFGESQTFLFHVLTVMKEKFKTKPPKARGTAGTDIVRHWCIHDADQTEHVIPWITNALRDPRTRTLHDDGEPFQQILQASELSLAVLETSFRFRESNATLYGMNEGDFDDGVFVSSYDNLPEFWTSQSMVYSETENLLDLELDSCRSWMQASKTFDQDPGKAIQSQIARNTARRLRIFGKIHRERIQWLSAQKTPKLSDQSMALEEAHLRNRKWQIFKMAGIGQLEEAISLAEEFRDMNALVELMVELQDQVEAQGISNTYDTVTTPSVESRKANFDRKVSEYFGKFGEAWADAFFARHIDMRQPGSLLTMKKYQQYITRFLRKSKRFSRWAWINDVIGENDYKSASDTLKSLALDQERSLWNMRVEISLAKLNILAAEEDQEQPGGAAARQDLQNFDSFAEIGGIQEVVYEHVLPALHGAIDQKAELDLAMEHFAHHTTRDRPAMRELLRQSLAKLIAREVLPPDQLIDLLTLMDSTRFLEGDDSGVTGREFHLALRVLNLSSSLKMNPSYYDFLLKTIWRRCYIRDDWVAIQQADEAESDQQLLHISHTSLFGTLQQSEADVRTQDKKDVMPYEKTSPSETLRSHLENSDFRARFRTDQWVHVLQDLEQERDTLSRYIERGNLDAWFHSMLPRMAQKQNSETTVNGSIKPATQLHDEEATMHSRSKARLNWL